MKNKKETINILIIISSIIIIGLLYYILFFFNKQENYYFKLNEDNVLLKVGTKKQLNYAISDDNIDITWYSNSDSVSVNDNGEVTANNYGIAKITAMVVTNEETFYDTCNIIPYTGDEGVSIKDINSSIKSLSMKPNSSYDIPFTIDPSNAYITAINYYSSDENVIFIENGKIVSKNEGTATFTMIINNQLVKELVVEVSKDATGFTEIDTEKKVKSVSLIKDFTMEMGDIKKISYEVNPSDGNIQKIEWFSSNEKIIKVNDGTVEAINIGEAVVKVVINDEVESSVKIKVNSSNSSIVINYNPKTLIRIGEKTNIQASISPIGLNDTIVYRSSNPSVAMVNNGIITGVNHGSAVITLSISSGKTKTFTINVLPLNGHISGSANLWGYKSLNDKVPSLADMSFYRSLAQSGIGTLQDNKYIVTSEGITYTYDINASELTVKNKRIKLRIFYPRGVDLSITNTLTFMGGRGETNFGGLFTEIEKNPSIVKSSGILALVAEGKGISFDGDAGAYSTMFVKAITRQKSNVKNSILGFSDGAHKVMHASNKVVYDKIIVFSGYTDGVESLANAKNSEVMFIVAPNDGNYSQAKVALRNMKNSGYSNVKFITNGTDAINAFSDKFLVITPGSLMKNAHDTINILNSGIISYCND